VLNLLKMNATTVFSAFLQNNKFMGYRRMYWSDCSGPATIQTARVSDGGDQRILISDDQHTCIVDIAIDFDSTHISIIVNAKLRRNSSVHLSTLT